MPEQPVNLGPFVKIYGKILRSSVWLEPLHVRVMWISLLASANAEGVVLGSMRGLAHAANVTPEQGRDALDVLASPDPDSSSPEHEGRRIEIIDGGVRILNHSRYREARTISQVKAVQRTQRWREKKKAEAVTDRHRPSQPSTLTRVTTEADTEADLEAEAEHPPNPPRGGQGFALEPPAPSRPKRKTRTKRDGCTDEQWAAVVEAWAEARRLGGMSARWGAWGDNATNRRHAARIWADGYTGQDLLAVMRHIGQGLAAGTHDPKWTSLEHVARTMGRYLHEAESTMPVASGRLGPEELDEFAANLDAFCAGGTRR